MPYPCTHDNNAFDPWLAGVIFDGHPASVLIDHLLSTCMTLSESYFRARAVITFVIKKPYNRSVDVLVHGRGILCELAPKTCRNAFTTVVFQQGRTNHTCIDQPTPCPGAEICIPFGMTSQDGNMVSCRYRCTCPYFSLNEDTSCEAILFPIGTGAQSETGEDIEICSLNVE